MAFPLANDSITFRPPLSPCLNFDLFHFDLGRCCGRRSLEDVNVVEGCRPLPFSGHFSRVAKSCSGRRKCRLETSVLELEALGPKKRKPERTLFRFIPILLPKKQLLFSSPAFTPPPHIFLKYLGSTLGGSPGNQQAGDLPSLTEEWESY